jgi:glucan 1,3-beta-glucosidase
MRRIDLVDRRTLLKASAAAVGVLIGGGEMAAQAQPDTQPATKPKEKLRGVNLGSWLVLEKWMNPAPYAGAKAEDEYSLSLELGKERAAAVLKQHRETWITAEDFQWIAARGLNMVRIPVGYWVLEENPPFISGAETLDWAFRTAKANGIGVLLDLHGAPGSQNGWDHSGRAGSLGWHASKENIDHSLRVVEDLAAHCKQFDNLIGFELLNEPRWDVPLDILKTYYQEAYRRVRKHLSSERTAVVIHDGFRQNDWANFMQEPDYANVILDTHMYQCYTDEDRKRDIYAQVEVAGLERKRQLDRMQGQLPCMVGEWSCALDPQSLRGLSGFSLDAGIRAYGSAQLISYETTKGWCFWTYKTEGGGGWSFRDCVKNGWLPDRYTV